MNIEKMLVCRATDAKHQTTSYVHFFFERSAFELLCLVYSRNNFDLTNFQGTDFYLLQEQVWCIVGSVGRVAERTIHSCATGFELRKED